VDGGVEGNGAGADRRKGRAPVAIVLPAPLPSPYPVCVQDKPTALPLILPANVSSTKASFSDPPLIEFKNVAFA